MGSLLRQMWFLCWNLELSPALVESVQMAVQRSTPINFSRVYPRPIGPAYPHRSNTLWPGEATQYPCTRHNFLKKKSTRQNKYPFTTRQATSILTAHYVNRYGHCSKTSLSTGYSHSLKADNTTQPSKYHQRVEYTNFIALLAHLIVNLHQSYVYQTQ